MLFLHVFIEIPLQYLLQRVFEKIKKYKIDRFLTIFGIILAMFLISQSYDFDAGAPLGVE